MGGGNRKKVKFNNCLIYFIRTNVVVFWHIVSLVEFFPPLEYRLAFSLPVASHMVPVVVWVVESIAASISSAKSIVSM